MKKIVEFFVQRLIAGALVITPIYLAALLLFKLTVSLLELMRPLTAAMPDWIPAENIVSVFLILVICFLVGVAIRTARGRANWERLENVFASKIPGYALTRNLTQRLAGDAQGNTWKPALAEIEDALVPAFIMEEFADGRFTVFVPSIPTPFAGAVYVLPPDRVHPVNVPFTEAIKAISRWGSGTKDMVAAMEVREHRKLEKPIA